MKVKILKFLFGVMFTSGVAAMVIALQRGDFQMIFGPLLPWTLVSLIFAHFYGE